jgi:hypothetical protein
MKKTKKAKEKRTIEERLDFLEFAVLGLVRVQAHMVLSQPRGFPSGIFPLDLSNVKMPKSKKGKKK